MSDVRALLLLEDEGALALNPDGSGALVIFDPETGKGAECCCEAACCFRVVNGWGTAAPCYNGHPGRCPGFPECCDWGRRFRLQVNYAGYFTFVGGSPTGGESSCNDSRSFSFSAVFECVPRFPDDGCPPIPRLLYCESFEFAFASEGSTHPFGCPTESGGGSGCGDLDDPVVRWADGRASKRFVMEALAFWLWSGNSGAFADASLIGPTLLWFEICEPANPCHVACAVDFEDGCPPTTLQHDFITADCRSGYAVTVLDQPYCVTTGDGDYRSYYGTCSGDWKVTALVLCDEGPCPPPPPPPLTCDEFLACFTSGNPCADVNGDGFVDGLDYDTFMNANPDCADISRGSEDQRTRKRQARLIRRAGASMKVQGYVQSRVPRPGQRGPVRPSRRPARRPAGPPVRMGGRLVGGRPLSRASLRAGVRRDPAGLVAGVRV